MVKLHHIFTDNMDITYFYCIGYSIQTIPDFHGNTRRFMPVHSVEMSEIRENVNQEFVEKYEGRQSLTAALCVWDGVTDHRPVSGQPRG